MVEGRCSVEGQLGGVADFFCVPARAAISECLDLLEGNSSEGQPEGSAIASASNHRGQPSR